MDYKVINKAKEELSNKQDLIKHLKSLLEEALINLAQTKDYIFVKDYVALQRAIECVENCDKTDFR